ncbi:glycine, alanine and asparagine-rich protein-like [Littorina saxatilis]|uniref:glycine, alanine and asparagine-rich protein-like n=1 Tax=Littorina saxatilis TaxID=31220 RepID=UPI0038B50C7F
MRLFLVFASLAIASAQAGGRVGASASASGGGSLLGGLLGGGGGGGGLLGGLPVVGGLLGGDGGGLLGGLLGENGIVGGLLNGGVLGNLGQTLQDTLGSLGATVGELLDTVLQLVSDIVNNLAEALRTGTNVSGAVAVSAVELVRSVSVEQLGAAVAEIVRDLPSLGVAGVNRLVTQIAINLPATSAARFLLDVRTLVPSVNIGQVLANLSLNLGVSNILDIAVVLAPRLNLDVSALLSSILNFLPVSDLNTFVVGARTRLGARVGVEALACRAVTRQSLRC